jgi:hypothetical protein
LHDKGEATGADPEADRLGGRSDGGSDSDEPRLLLPLPELIDGRSLVSDLSCSDSGGDIGSDGDDDDDDDDSGGGDESTCSGGPNSGRSATVSAGKLLRQRQRQQLLGAGTGQRFSHLLPSAAAALPPPLLSGDLADCEHAASTLAPAPKPAFLLSAFASAAEPIVAPVLVPPGLAATAVTGPAPGAVPGLASGLHTANTVSASSPAMFALTAPAAPPRRRSLRELNVPLAVPSDLPPPPQSLPQLGSTAALEAPAGRRRSLGSLSAAVAAATAAAAALHTADREAAASDATVTVNEAISKVFGKDIVD